MGTETVVIQTPSEVTEKVSAEIVESTAETALDTAVAIVQVADQIAEKITEAREESDGEVFEVLSRLDAIISTLGNLEIRIEALFEKFEEFRSLEVAEIIVENTPAKVEEVAAVAELVEEEPPVVVEEVDVAVTPQIKAKKSRRWL